MPSGVLTAGRPFCQNPYDESSSWSPPGASDAQAHVSRSPASPWGSCRSFVQTGEGRQNGQVDAGLVWPGFDRPKARIQAHRKAKLGNIALGVRRSPDRRKPSA